MNVFGASRNAPSLTSRTSLIGWARLPIEKTQYRYDADELMLHFISLLRLTAYTAHGDSSQNSPSAYKYIEPFQPVYSVPYENTLGDNEF